MHETKHTPAPWTVEGDLQLWVSPADRRESVICDIVPRKSGADCTDKDYANACVIAAAPDMLAVLEAILPLTEPSRAYAPSVADAVEEGAAGFRARMPGMIRAVEERAALVERLPSMIRAAIAKARGTEVQL